MNIFNISINITIVLVIIIIASLHYKYNTDYLSYLICTISVFTAICIYFYKYILNNKIKNILHNNRIENFYGDGGIALQDQIRASLDIFTPEIKYTNIDKNRTCGGLCVDNYIGQKVPYIQNDYNFNESSINKYIYLYFFDYLHNITDMAIINGLVYIEPIIDSSPNLNDRKAVFYYIANPYNKSNTSSTSDTSNKWAKSIDNYSMLNERYVIFFDAKLKLDMYGYILLNEYKIGKWKYSNQNYIDGKKWIPKDTTIPPINQNVQFNQDSLYNVINNTCSSITNIPNGIYSIIGVDNKYLSFKSSGIDTDIYTSPGPTSFCDAVTPDKFIKKNKNIKKTDNTLYDMVQYNFENPQMWNIKLSNPELNNCAVFICTYSKNTDKPVYYLTAHNDGALTMSLFGGASNQMWYLEDIDNNIRNTFIISLLIANIDNIFNSYKYFSNKNNNETYTYSNANKYNDVDAIYKKNGCAETKYGCCPGENKESTSNKGNCSNKCIKLSNEKIDVAKKNALDILNDSSKNVSTKLNDINKIINGCELINCSPCYKKMIDAYSSYNNGIFLDKLYHIKSAKYDTYLTSDINGTTNIDFNNVLLTGQKGGERAIWSVIPYGTSISSYLETKNNDYNLKKISLPID